MEKLSTGRASGHHLVAAETKMKLLALKKPSSACSKHCTNRLKDQIGREEFVLSLPNRRDFLCNGLDGEEKAEFDISKEWDSIKEMYLSTYKEVLGNAKNERKRR